MPDKISKLSSAVADLESVFESKSKSVRLEELDRALSNIRSVVEAIGDVPRLNSMRDDGESLKRTIYSLRELEDQSRNFALKLRGSEIDELENTSRILKEIHGLTQERQHYIARRAEALSRYSR